MVCGSRRASELAEGIVWVFLRAKDGDVVSNKVAITVARVRFIKTSPDQKLSGQDDGRNDEGEGPAQYLIVSLYLVFRRCGPTGIL